MSDLHAPQPIPAQGERLLREAYRRDFRQREAVLRDRDSWKLERRQHVEEQAVPSYDASRLGGRTLYRVLCTDGTAPRPVRCWEDYIRGLYETGEDVRSYVGLSSFTAGSKTE
ncbi:hypothetical protein [Streptosporangium saharense]|uniref:Uncharacterized protein n=1 Tax=Streptosporangium saharense TaxID=1706840 RepID=A0A7W7VQ82_9ACTN|nr:hypothetical protein [Streptosporangium saharense]MBB4918732.1 hypothetical protein [Streptosporangium saharense]